jgi:hypothetical protein
VPKPRRPEYLPTTAMRALVGISPTYLLRLVALRSVRVRVRPDGNPTYHVGDVLEVIKGRPVHANRKFPLGCGVAPRGCKQKATVEFVTPDN